MAFEYPYQESPFSQSVHGFSLGMSNAHGLPNFDHQYSAHMFDMSNQPQDLSTPGTSAGSTSSLQGGERTETKPRLAKEEVSRLEAIFKANHKPTSNTKRKLAEDMHVEVARINNWFQNRRAKAKQEKKQDEFERSQREQQSLSKPSSQDETAHQQQMELYSGDYDLHEHSGSSFSSPSGPSSTTTISCHPQYDDPTAASLVSYERSMEAARVGAQGGTFVNEHLNSLPSPGMSLPENCLDDGAGGDRARFPSSDSMDLPSDDWAENNSGFTNPFLMPDATHFQAEIAPPMEQDSFNSIMENSDLDSVGPMSHLLPSQLLNPNHNQTTAQAHEEFVRHYDRPEFSKPEPNSEPQYQPQPDGQLRFRSPPSSINIAARRSKPRPAALGTTPRSNSFVGPRTLAHSPTINRSAASPMSPRFMRRIVSTTNLNSYVNMHGSRVQKSYPTSAQRSPINLNGFADTKAFFDTNAHNIKRPSVTVSNASGVHPPTPLSPQDLQREMTSSSSSSDDTNMLSNSAYGSDFFTHPDFGDSNLASPPETPAFSLDVPPNHWSSYNLSDEPLHTPGTVTFGSDLQQYMSPLNSSQPNTPGLPPYLAAGFAYNNGTPQYGFQASGSNSNDNLFLAANPRYVSGYMKSSPESGKEFLFQNHTAKDYETMSK